MVYSSLANLYTIGKKETLIGGVTMGLESIGKNIRKFRVANHLRLEDLAEKVGLSVNYVGALERGEKLPSLETFINIANCLQVTSNELLADELTTGYQIKDCLLTEKLNGLAVEDRERIYDVIDTLLRHSKQQV